MSANTRTTAVSNRRRIEDLKGPTLRPLQLGPPDSFLGGVLRERAIQRLAYVIADVGSGIEQMSRDFARRNFRTRSFRDYRCLHCGNDYNLTLRGKFGWVCVDTIRCTTKAPNAPTRELTAPETGNMKGAAS